MCLAQGTDYLGPDSMIVAEIPDVTTPQLCYEYCMLYPECLHFTFNGGSDVCILKREFDTVDPTASHLISGPVPCN